jgi:hypothetical protein
MTAGRVRTLASALLLALTFTVLMSANGHAQQSQKGAKASKAAKTQSKAGPPAVLVELQPKALEIVKAACDKLAAARTMRFTAVVTYEHPSLVGPALAYTTKSEVTMQRPDKLRVVTPADGPASEFYYDGKKMTALSPAENMVAVADAPPTIDAALKAAYDSAAIYFPFSDVIVADPYKDLTEGLKIAFYIGQSRIVGGTTTDMVAFVNDAVFVQIWIGAEDKLPRMLRAVYRDDRLRLRHQLELSNWQLDTAVPADTFTPTIAANALPIPFARPDPQPTQGAKPPAKPKAKPKAGPNSRPPGK